MRNQVLGNRYRIQDRIGEGGMAFVYVAVDEKLGRRVAIKVLHEHMERNQDIRKRFQMEAQAISALDHPNVVKIYDFSGDETAGGRLWIVTEVIKGQNLAQYVQQFAGGWLHPVIAACIVRELLKALTAAHAHGIVHRDVKPENAMVTVDGQVKLMDFGIAKDLGKTSMTVTGTFMGSPSYMSPEQIRGRDVDLRSDLYSLAVLFYEIVTGRLPFTGNTTHDVVLKIMEGEFTYPRFLVPSLPDALDAMIVRGMAKDQAHRFQSAPDFARAVDHFLGAMGFDESHIELERFFKDPRAYEDRLARTKIASAQQDAKDKKTRTVPKLPTQIPQNNPRISNAKAPQRTTQPVQNATEKLPAPPPFRNQDTWQQHLPAKTQVVAVGHIPSTADQVATQQLPQRQATQQQQQQRPATQQQQPQQQQRPATQHQRPQRIPTQFVPHQQQASAQIYVPQPALDPSSPRRQAGYNLRPQQRRRQSVRVARFTLTQESWLGYVFGILLVGLVGIVSIFGFYEVQQRLATKRTNRTTEGRPDRPDRTATKGPKLNEGKRNGTPLVVKTIVRKPTAPATTPPPKLVKATKTKKDKLAKTTKTKKDKWTNATKTVTVVATPASEASEPNLSVETVEIKKTAAPAAPAPALAQPEPAPAPEPAETPAIEPVATQPEPAPAPEPAVAKPGKAKVSVSSDPAAEIFIDGRRVGTTVDNTSGSGWIALTSGKHRLELRRQGYLPYKASFDLEAGEQRSLPRVNLELLNGGGPGNASNAPPQKQGTALTVKVSTFPAQVTIRNLDNNTTQAFTMKATSKLVPLESGRYQIKVERKGETKERDLNLTGSTGHLTFTADFKDD